MAIRDKALRLDLLPKLPALIQSMWGTVETDMSPQDVLTLAQIAVKVKTENIKTASIDNTMTVEYRTTSGADVLWPDRAKIGRMMDQIIPQDNGGLVDQARRIQQEGARVVVGGGRPKEHGRGYFVEPTVIDGLPKDHPFFTQELFVPITVVGDVMTLDEAVEHANRVDYGLTAGIFTQDDKEIEEFFDSIQAGVVYANRRAGATTGAWPGQNSFGGWKASGSTGKGTGGPHYLQQFFREQSRTRIR